ncbi:MAG: substrate-binding domain-containing protein [Treponema sp.]|nr:substrate-binding domain-containing protein [Treponema sp.]
MRLTCDAAKTVPIATTVKSTSAIPNLFALPLFSPLLYTGTPAPQQDFTAVFAATDELAIGAIQVLKDEDLRVPEAVSVIGFDNIKSSNYFIPWLTTIHQPIEEIGEQAAHNLPGRISGNTDFEIIIPHKLIIRKSTCSIGAKG